MIFAMTLWPFILATKDERGMPVLMNHERIHLRQQIELMVIPFYILYIVNYFVLSIRYFSSGKGYKQNLFEREAYVNEEDFQYLEKRKFWAAFKNLRISDVVSIVLGIVVAFLLAWYVYAVINQ